jgi:hypothetical protein
MVGGMDDEAKAARLGTLSSDSVKETVTGSLDFLSTSVLQADVPSFGFDAAGMGGFANRQPDTRLGTPRSAL